ncbi:MAG: hypothetical protein CMM07_16800 [Rhodopirellula sp.]|nr:hypothetical protein [Rhodopirellula sp.]
MANDDAAGQLELHNLDYTTLFITKYRTAGYHGRKQFVFVRTMLALTLLRFVRTIRLQVLFA